MGCQPGSSAPQYSTTSVTMRSDARGGKIHVPRATYSLRMSFCTVPAIFRGSTPCRRAAATYKASRMMAVALIVIEVDTRSRGMPSNRTLMSSMESMATPTRPTSPRASGWSES